jgi:hypothetical protein
MRRLTLMVVAVPLLTAVLAEGASAATIESALAGTLAAG